MTQGNLISSVDPIVSTFMPGDDEVLWEHCLSTFQTHFLTYDNQEGRYYIFRSPPLGTAGLVTVAENRGCPQPQNCEPELPNLAAEACLPSQCLLLLGWLPVSSQPKKGQCSPTGSNCFGNLTEHLCPIRLNIHTRRSGGPRPNITGSAEPWKGLRSRRRGS